jgi:O-antigen ligase
MAETKGISKTASRVFALFLFPAFALATLLPALPVAVWTARDAAIQVLAALALVWMIFLGWRRSRRGAGLTFTLDIVDVLFLAVLGWFAVSAGNSRQPFESSVALRGAFATLCAWFAIRAAWRRWPGLFDAFRTLALVTGALTALWIVAQTVQARWVAPEAVFTRFNLAALGLGILLSASAAFLRRTKAAPFLWSGGVLFLGLALTWGLRLEQREGPFPNTNIAAGFLGILLLVALFRALKGGWAPRALSVLLFLAWAVTQSRGAFLSMVVVAAALSLSHMRTLEQRLSTWSRTRWALASLAALAAVLVMVPMVARFFNAFEMDPRSYWRILVWESALKMALQAPLLGYGPGTFGDVYPYFRHPAVWAAQNPFAHSEYLQVAAECGWPALVGVLLLLAVVVVNLARRASAFREAEVALWITVLAAVHNAVDFTFHEWSLRLVLMAFVAFALRKPAAGELDLSFRLSPRGAAFAAAAAGAFLLLQGGWFSVRDYFARAHYARGLAHQNEGRLDAAEAALRRSLAFRADFMGPWNSLGVLELARAEKAASRSDAMPHVRRAKECLEKAMEVDAYSLAPRENYVGFLLKTGSLADAYATQHGLTAGMPSYPPHHVAEVRILLLMGRAREAVAVLDAALKVDAYYIPVRVLRAEALERAGDRAGARDEYREIRRIVKELGLRDDEGLVERNLRRLGGR